MNKKLLKCFLSVVMLFVMVSSISFGVLAETGAPSVEENQVKSQFVEGELDVPVVIAEL